MTASQRHRTTWTKPGDGTSREAATSRKADPYSMNQEHPQPSPVDYESGDPDAWAETPTGNQLVYDGYEGGEGGREMRNEVNFAEFKPETFGHKDDKEWKGPGKYDNAKVSAAMRKANAAERIARATLRTSDDALVEAQAVDLMALPDKVLVATLRRLDAVSPDALPKDRKYKRAMACCKFAADVLGEAVTNGPKGQDTVERLGRTLMSIDDPTLREMFKIVAGARAAAHDEEEEEEEGGESTSSAKKQSGEVEIKFDGEEEEEDGGETAGLDAGGIESGGSGTLGADDLAMLDSMLEAEACPPAAPAPAPTGDLADLFEAPAAPAMPMQAPAMPGMASNGPEITFGGDDEDPPARTASSNSDAALSTLFDDHPEVVAQREISAAQAEQRAREGGYGPVSDVRTASDGAKRLGNVRGGKPSSVDESLETLWERPGA